MKRINEDATKGAEKKSKYHNRTSSYSESSLGLAIGVKCDADRRSHSVSPTRLEDLSNEIIYEICDYLDAFHIYQAFSGLNQCFSHLLMSPTLPLKINITSLSKSNFQDYSGHFVIPHSHQVISLCMRNPLNYDLSISPHRFLSTFSGLKTLVLEHVDSKYIDNILKGAASLSNLSTLVLIIDGHVWDGNELLLRVFRISTLKYCKLYFSDGIRTGPLPFASDEHSNIEQLALQYFIYFHQLDRILSYVPRLRRFSIDSPMKINIEYEFQPSFPLSHFTHLFLKLLSGKFDDFERLMKSFFSTTEVLHLEVWGESEFLDAHRWEQFITSSLPRLRIFDLLVYPRRHMAYDSRVSQFNSSFWSQRQWYFAHKDVLNYSGSHETNLFSIAPYRRQDYTIQGPLTVPSYLDDQSKRLNAVRRVHIYNAELLHDYPFYFPHATDLFITSNILPVTDLKRIVALQNVTNLQITINQFSWEQLLEILLWTPNLATLSTRNTVMDSWKLNIIRQSENFQSVANSNIIREFTIQNIKDKEEMKSIFSLFPRLESFSIDDTARRTATLIRALFSKSNGFGRYLNFLTIGTKDNKYLSRIDSLTREGQFLADFSYQIEHSRLHLWR